MKLKLLIGFCIVLGTIQGWAQIPGPVFRRLDAPADVKILDSFCTFQDSDGLVWLGTNNGIYSYDGYTFKHYDNPVEGDFTIGAIQEVNGKLWLGCWRGAGLWEFDKNTGKFRNAKDIPGFPSFFNDVFCARQFHLAGNNLWFITTMNQRKGSAIVKYNLATKQFYHRIFPNPPSLDRLEFNSITRTAHQGDEVIWIGTSSNGMYAFRPNTDELAVYHQKPGDVSTLSNSDVRHVYASASEPVLWVGTLQGLNKFDLTTRRVTEQYFQSSPSPRSLSSDDVWTLLEINRKLWIATADGLNQLDLNTNTLKRFKSQPKDAETISGNNVRGLYQKDDLLWLTTFGKGINTIDLRPGGFHFYPLATESPDGLAGNFINDIVRGQFKGKNGLWLDTGGGLYFFDPNTGKFDNRHKQNKLTFFSIFPQGDVIWGETNQGFSKLEATTGKLEILPFRPGLRDSIQMFEMTDFSPSFLDDPYSLWAGSWEHGLSYLNTKTGFLRNYQPNVMNPTSSGGGKQVLRITPVQFRGKKYVFFVSVVPTLSGNVQTVKNCLVRFEPATNQYKYYIQDPKNPHAVSASYFTSLHNAGDSVLWIGVGKFGLEKFSLATERFTQYKNTNGDMRVFNATTDLKGNVWMSVSEGIAKLNPRNGVVSLFRRKNMGGSFWTLAERDRYGNIYFGIGQGLIQFHPDSIQAENTVPTTLVTSLKVFDKEYSPGRAISMGQLITLSHEQNFLSFEFAALNYRDPDRNVYQYQMVGVDKDWVSANGRRFASYTNLEPGSYEFRVRSSNTDGMWNPKWTTVSIVVTPPFWQTWWFRVLTLATILFALFVIYRLRVRSLRQRQFALEKQVRARTAEIIHQKEEIAIQQEQLTRMNDYLKVLSDTLEERVQTRTGELLKANEELRRKNEEIQQALVKGQTIERKRVAAELHDNLGGLLSALKMNLEMMNASQLTEAEKLLYINVLEMVTNACVEVRNISHNMLPEVLEKEGIAVALERMLHAINAGRKINFEWNFFGMEQRLEKQVEYNLYPVCVELINNIIKHSQATHASIQIIQVQHELSVTVEDNGKGIKEKAIADSGIGLKNIQSRIQALRGTCRIDSVPGHGTTVSIEIPLKKRKQKTMNLN